MNNPAAELADSQHPWIGLASFTEEDRAFFAGRADEIDDIVRLVRRDTLTLLYGVSGLGKTSLVQAGLFPALRKDNFLPVPIRPDYLEGAAPLSRQIIDAIGAAALAAKVEAPPPRPDETLWEYFHREGNHFWSSRNDLVTPLLAFDQFEEFFTLGRETPARAARGEAFVAELADLAEDRPPAALRDDPSRAKDFNFKPAPLKVLLAMREDYLADLDRIRSHFRALGQNRLRLLPMGERQARQVIALGASLLAPGVEDRIVKYVAGGAAHVGEMTVAPALLSLALRELNQRRLARGPEAKITPDLLDVEQHKIFEDFYLRTLQDFPAGVRLFIEDELLTASGHRDSCALDDALTRPDVTLPVLNELVNRRLLAYEDRHHTRRVELTHDVLVPVIKASRDSRLTREALAQTERLKMAQRAQRRKQRITAAVAGALALTLLATIWGGYYAFIQEHKAYYRDFARRHGFPVGIGQISESEARRLPVFFRLVSKGMTLDGWTPRWKPAFRVIALNGLLKPTTRHGVATYLWRGESESETAEGARPGDKGLRLGLQTVCQWEFVPTANGEILYERGLEQDGHMVFGLIYSPPGSGAPDTRLARFVGPDGFPQLQRSSAAEYVVIHYDKEGWEDRITYRDGKNVPAAGLYGAFGQKHDHNSRGQTTRVMSLDENGNTTTDTAGNCGMEEIYDEKGLLVESHSIGPDLKPMPVNDGYVVAKFQNDGFGRLRRTTFYGLNNEPVLHKDGSHGWEREYDERGNEIASSFLGLDGKLASIQGYATRKYSYDGHGNITREGFYGSNGGPVLLKEGYHGSTLRYDGRGNLVMITYIGKDDRAILLSEGYAIRKSNYDSRNRVTRETYYEVNGEPVRLKSGYHGLESQYDERDDPVLTTYIGLDNKPILLPEGYAARKNIYDSRGKLTRQTYYGVNGEPVLYAKLFHGSESKYDERGNKTVTTYLGLDEKPALVPAGFVTIRRTFDARNNVVRETYHGIDGEPALGNEGHHGWEAKYDEGGKQIEKVDIDLDGKPAASKPTAPAQDERRQKKGGLGALPRPKN